VAYKTTTHNKNPKPRMRDKMREERIFFKNKPMFLLVHRITFIEKGPTYFAYIILF
jgi:hypothetical protein